MSFPACGDSSSPSSDDHFDKVYQATQLPEGEPTEIGKDNQCNISSPTHSFPPSLEYDTQSGITSKFKSPIPSWHADNCRGRDAETSLSDPYFQSTKPFSVGAGMENVGNTCFLNAVLQCIVHNVELLNAIVSNKHLLHSNCPEGEFCLLCALGELIELSLVSGNRVVIPWRFVNNLTYFSSSFQRYQQEDAHEFFQCFLDKLETSLDSMSKGCISPQSDNLVKEVFGGRLLSKLKCCKCDHFSDTYEPSINLSLEIEDADKLETALESFTKVERIEDPEIKFTCENCKEQVFMEKQMIFDQVPSVAVFHLKRFKNDGCVIEKIDKHVAFPLDLDLLPFTGSQSKNDGGLKYALNSIVVHSGSSTCGHYFCFVRVSPKMWYKFDDSRVVLVHEEYVLSQEAYILFYAKEGTPWFSTFIETQSFYRNSAISDTSPKSVLDFDSNKAMADSGPETRAAYTDDSSVAMPLDAQEDVSPSLVERNINVSVANSQNEVPETLPRCQSPEVQRAQNEVSPSLVERSNHFPEVSAVANDQNDIIKTLFRSPSPEIYRGDTTDAGFSIPRDHLRRADRMSCKRRLDKDMDDLETKQARTFIMKSIPRSRGQQLLSALRGSKTDPSFDRKKKRRGFGQGTDRSHTLVAGSYR